MSEARSLADHARAARDAQGESTLGDDAATARIDHDLSRAFAPPPTGLAERLQAAEASILDDVAIGRIANALDAGDAILESVEDHIEALAREPATAASIGNVCLFTVRAELQSRQADRARARAARCLRLLPTLEVDPNLHPPDVVALVQRLRRDLEAGLAGGVLSVQGATDDPAGCSIRVNGSVVGATPWVRVPLPAGAYRVQIECGSDRPGRVAAVDVTAEESTRATVSARLSSSLDTTTGIFLRYDDAATLEGLLADDVGVLAAALGVDRVLVGMVVAGEAALTAFEIDGSGAAGPRALLSGRAAVEEPRDASASAAVERARSGAGVSGEGPSNRSATGASSGTVDVGLAALGGTLVVAGAAGLGVAWYLWTDTEARGRVLNDTTSVDLILARQRDFDGSLVPLAVVGALSGVSASVGASVLMTQSDDPLPWWSWVAGGAGVVLLGVGVGLMFVEGECYGNASVDTSCVRRAPTALLGALVLEHAAPLLAVPIASLVRAALGPGADAARVSMRVQPNDFYVSLSSTF